MDNIDGAVYALVHQFPGGAPALSAALYSQYGYRVAPGTLMNKANPDQEHQLTVREALLIQSIQHKYHLLFAEAHRLNHAAIPLGDFSATSDVELLDTYTRLHKELGALAAAIHEALADGRITGVEFMRIRRKNSDMIRAALEMEQRFEALAEDLPYTVGQPHNRCTSGD